MQSSGELGRLRWKCRRGLLELDIILLFFLDHCYVTLSFQQQQVFESILAEHDPVLQSWLVGQAIPEDIEKADMVKYILRAYTRSE